jgi:hypothetical protein
MGRGRTDLPGGLREIVSQALELLNQVFTKYKKIG